MISPLSFWKSEKVSSLLGEFYESNFKKAGVEEGIGREIIRTAFELRNRESEESLREIVNALFLKAKTNLTKFSSEIDKLSLIDFTNVNSIADIGANKLDTLNKIARFYPHIEKLVGIDINPPFKISKYKDKIKYYQVQSDSTSYPLGKNCFDVINFQFSLHHFQSEKQIREVILNCKNYLKRNGRLIIWEESFENEINLKDLVAGNNSLGIRTDFNLTKKFYDLSREKRFEFIIVNDWLINVNNPHMQWTGLYKDRDEWIYLFNSCGFTCIKKTNLGLRVSGHIKSGVQILAEFALV